jgi:hypothetical protein
VSLGVDIVYLKLDAVVWGPDASVDDGRLGYQPPSERWRKGNGDESGYSCDHEYRCDWEWGGDG